MRVAIVLAAGRSRRWGAANKLLARIGGEAMVVRAARIARAAPVGRVIVVVGAQGARVARTVRAAGLARVTVVRAVDHAEGIGASIRAGLRALRPGERTVLLFLGDMPAVPTSLAARLLRAMRADDRSVRPIHRGVPGHPVLVRRPDLPTIAELHGDRGLAPLLRRARTVRAPRGAILDLDRRTDRARLR